MKRAKLNGKPIIDATGPMTIKVTRRDVGKAKQGDPTMCALANGALHDQEVISSRIGASVALIEYKKKVVRFSIKPEDQKKIKAFDKANYFQADTYELVPPKVPIGSGTKNHKAKPRVGKKEWKSVHKMAGTRHAQRVVKSEESDIVRAFREAGL